MNTYEAKCHVESIARKKFEQMIKDKLNLEGLCISLMSNVNSSCELEMTKTMLVGMREILKSRVEDMEKSLEILKKDFTNHNFLTQSEVEDIYMAVVQKLTQPDDEIGTEDVESESDESEPMQDDEILMAENLDTNINPTKDVSHEPEIDDANTTLDSDLNDSKDDVVKKIVSTLCSEDIITLKKLADEKRIAEDDYYRRTLLISKMGYKSEEKSYYKRCVETLESCGLSSLFLSCDKFYVTTKGDIRLTYPTRGECVLMLLQGKRSLQRKCSEIRRDIKASIEIMCPKSELETKLKLKKLGRMYKKDGKIQSYDVVQQKIQGVYVLKLRVFVRGFGSRAYEASKLFREGTNNMEIDILNFRQNNEE